MFAAQSHNFTRLTGRVSTLTHCLCELGYQDYSFFNPAVEEFQQGIESILTDSFETPKLNASFDEPDAKISSVSSGF